MGYFRSFLLMGFGFATALATADDSFVIGAQYWHATHDVNFESGGVTLPGTELSDSDVGLDENEGDPAGVIGIDFDGAFVHFRYSESELQGKTALTQDINFRNVLFSSGKNLTTNIDLEEVAFTVESDFDHDQDFSFGWLFGVNYFSFEAELKTPDKTARDDFKTIWMMPGLKLRKNIMEDYSFEAYAQAFSMKLNGKNLTSSELGAVFSWHGHEHMNVDLGWRFFNFDANEDDFEFDFEKTGPWFGFYYTF